MPDPFDPLPDLPAQTPTASDVAAQEHAAEWAKGFEPSTSQLARTPTSLALRARHRQDVTDYANTVEQQRMAAEQARLESDKNAAAYALRSRAMDMKARLDQFNMGLQLKKFDDAHAALPSIEAARQARANADASRVERDAALAKRQADIETHANNFQTELAGITAPEGTPEHDDAIIATVRKYPLARLDQSIAPVVKIAETNAQAARKQSLIDTQRAATAQKAKEAGMEPQSFTETGAETFHAPHAQTPSGVSPDAARVREIDKTILKKEQEWRDAKAKAPDKIPKSEADLLALRKQRDELAGATPATAQPIVKRTFVRDASGNLVEQK